MKIAFTVCSANYLPFAKTLADSLVRHNAGYQFVLALADTYNGYDEAFFAPHRIVPVTAMNLAALEEMNGRYTLFQLSCALKPFIAEWLLQEYPSCNRLFYFDSDIALYGALSEAETILENHCLVLTPHVSEALPFEAGTFTELDTLHAGIYNAGFFGINRSNESLSFLWWWKSRMEHLCLIDAERGLFVDQVWLSFAPLYFKTTFIQFNPGYNHAYWNFTHRKLSRKGEGYAVNEEYPLVFFHFSGYDVRRPGVLSKHRVAYSFDVYPEYEALYKNYAKAVWANGGEAYFPLPVTMGTAPKKKSRFRLF